jgi:ABC-2 type transport system permease protein
VGEPLAFAIVTSTGILVMAGLGTGIVFSIDTGDAGDIWRVVGAAVSYAPALWLAAAIAVAVFGLVPRLMVMAWTVPVYGLVVLLLGPLLGLPHWLHNASPFEQVPRLPAVDFNVIPLLIMSVIAALLIVAGLFGIRRRDMDFV